MSGQNGVSTPASTANYAGENPTPTENGTLQCGSWDSPVNGHRLDSLNNSVLEGVPSQTNVSVSGADVIRVGAPNQFKCQVSLTAGTVQLTGHVKTATNVNTDPALAPFVWISRQKFVATADSTGLVTLVGRGRTTIECRYPRAANLPFTNATPSGTEFAYATLDLTVTA